MGFLPKISADFFRKYPTTVVLILVTTIAGYFTRSFIASSNDNNQDCREQVINDRQIISRQDSQINNLNTRIYDLQQELLITNGIIRQIPDKVDSIARSVKKRKK